MKMVAMAEQCECEVLHGPPQTSEFEDLGVDRRNGRYGEVWMHRCVRCGAPWLHYLVEYEAFGRSGRWFCGRLDETAVGSVSASNAIATLAGLKWYWAGGSYFDGEVATRSGPVPVDLYGPAAVE